MNPSTAVVLVFGAVLYVTSTRPAFAQQTPPQLAQSSSAPKPTGSESTTVEKQTTADSTDDALLDGLLDLVPDATPGKQNESRPLTPADVGLTQDDLQQAKGPLEPIRQSMLISAGLLRQGDPQVTTLQSDILTRLDELISKLESKQSGESQQQQQNQSQQDRQQSSGESSGTRADDFSNQQSQSETGDTGSNNPSKMTDSASPDGTETDDSSQPKSSNGNEPASEKSNSEEISGRPSDRGGKTAASVRMNAPEAYQRTVWGQLPDRVRTSMQSRMVEQFLPTHREQIEVYYQKLLERYNEND
ncbi:MAG: hypothetical protein Aurels2KO_42000 [Aureliella sp.]